MSRRVVLVAGEASGDMYGGRLASALAEADPALRLEGVGGPAMAAAGVKLLADINRLSVMGTVEVLKRFSDLRAVWNKVVGSLAGDPPLGLVLIDFPGFNLGLAKEAKTLGIPVVYYVPPKLWVWGKWRMGALRQWVDKVLAIFPFEEPFYRMAGVPVSFVGNPLVEILDEESDGKDFAAAHGIGEADIAIGILPGSRPEEVRRLLPPFLEAGRLLARQMEGKVRFFLPRASTVPATLVGRYTSGADLPLTVLDGQARRVLSACRLSFTASGTATLEAFLLGAPQVVAYRTSWMTYFVGKRVIRVPRISLPNILAGRDVVTELLQHQVIPERLAREGLRLLEHDHTRESYLAAAAEVRTMLKGEGASRRAAEAALTVFSRGRGEAGRPS